MAWNDNNNQNPWGGNGQTPPELDEVIKDFKNKFGGIFGSKKSDKTPTTPTPPKRTHGSSALPSAPQRPVVR